MLSRILVPKISRQHSAIELHVKKLQKSKANLLGLVLCSLQYSSQFWHPSCCWVLLSLVKAVCIQRKANIAIQHDRQLSIIKWQLAVRYFCERLVHQLHKFLVLLTVRRWKHIGLQLSLELPRMRQRSSLLLC